MFKRDVEEDGWSGQERMCLRTYMFVGRDMVEDGWSGHEGMCLRTYIHVHICSPPPPAERSIEKKDPPPQNKYIYMQINDDLQTPIKKKGTTEMV